MGAAKRYCYTRRYVRQIYKGILDGEHSYETANEKGVTLKTNDRNIKRRINPWNIVSSLDFAKYTLRPCHSHNKVHGTFFAVDRFLTIATNYRDDNRVSTPTLKKLMPRYYCQEV